MSRIVSNSVSASSLDCWARPYRAGLALLAALCFALVPAGARAACGSFGSPGIKAAIKLPPAAFADLGFPLFPGGPTIVGLWHVTHNSPGDSLFNDTLDTWHADGTEFESAFLAPTGGDVCVGA